MLQREPNNAPGRAADEESWPYSVLRALTRIVEEDRSNFPATVLQVKTGASAAMAILVTFEAEIDLARGESFEGVKKMCFIKKQNIRLMFSVTNIIIGIDLKFTANKENM